MLLSENCHSFDGELSGYNIFREPITDAIQWASENWGLELESFF